MLKTACGYSVSSATSPNLSVSGYCARLSVIIHQLAISQKAEPWRRRGHWANSEIELNLSEEESALGLSLGQAKAGFRVPGPAPLASGAALMGSTEIDRARH